MITMAKETETQTEAGVQRKMMHYVGMDDIRANENGWALVDVSEIKWHEED